MKHRYRTRDYATSIPSYTALNALNYACLGFLNLAINITVGLVFLQHINQTREDTVELVRISELAVNLSQEVDDLDFANESYEKELQLNEKSFFHLEEELEMHVENLKRMEKENINLVSEKRKLEDEVLSLKKFSVLNLIMPRLTPHFLAGIVPTEIRESADINEPLIPLESLERWPQDTALQNTAKTQALKKFGKGPYLVMIELEFPPKYADPLGAVNKLVVEMAPLELMPYTVNHFLEQVSQKLYDGSSFVRSPEHVLQASHVPYFANRDADIYKPFVEANLERLAFQEYSQDYAHERYTMGFGGRPGGTEFYISMQNNTIAHGPGFRDQDADPCFAKVVRGFETLKRIQSIPCRDDDTILMDFVGIKAITILEDFDFDDYLGTELPPLLDLDKFKNASSIDLTRDPTIVKR